MEAKQFLDQLAENPPEAFHKGCAKIALKPFLRNLQLGGVYHEHGIYNGINKKLQAEAKGNIENADPLQAISTEKLSILDLHEWDSVDCKSGDQQFRSVETLDTELSTESTTDVSSGERLFTRTNTFDRIMEQDDGQTNDVITCDLEKRHKCKLNQTIFDVEQAIKDFLPRVTKEKTEHEIAGTNSTDYFKNDKILRKVGVAENQTVLAIISSLGYETASKEPVPGQEHQRNEVKRTWFRSFWSDRTYAAIVLLIIWGYNLRIIRYFYEELDIRITTKLTPILWTLMVACMDTCTFVSCVRQDHFFTFFYRWALLFMDPTTRRLGIRGVLSTKYVKKVLVVQWILIIFGFISVMFMMLIGEEFSGGLSTFFCLTRHHSLLSLSLSAVGLLFSTFSYIGVMALIVVMCHHVCSHFLELNQVMRLHIAAASSGFPRHLKQLRERHFAMCENVKILDRFMRTTVAFQFSFMIAMACLIIYQLVNVSMDASATFINVYWLACCLFFVFIVSHHMANVNQAMHSISNDLYTIQTANITMEEFSQLQLFLAKVTSSHMGFTVLGLVVITREAMLTLFGLFITYGVVLLQFR